ncbi:MAG: hypothetical protein LBO81_01500 [Clostridiales Family XIII bacterium]|jgi:endoglucanase|nr:hypothetical protein [Clostridiales Family XIII bacterium]
MKEYLKVLSSLDGVSGREDRVRDFIADRVRPHATTVETDVLKNLFVWKKGKGTPDRPIVVAAAMDEWGFVAEEAKDSGAIALSAVDGMDPKAVIGKRFRVAGGETRGVISVVSQHLTGKTGTDKVPELRELALDVGAKNKEGGKAAVKPGEGIVYDYPFAEFGDGFYRGKAVDARLGASVLLRLIEEVSPALDTWFVFTASSKIEHRGGVVAARRIDPGTVLTVEAAAAGDVPLQKPALWSVRVGEGATLGLKEFGSVYTRELRERLARIAAKNGVKVQIRSGMRGSGDAGTLHTRASGAKVAGIGAPVRYVGTGNPIVHRDDLEALWQLAKLFVEEV